METPESFTGWPGLALRLGYWLLLAVLSVVSVASVAGLAGFVWTRWLA